MEIRFKHYVAASDRRLSDISKEIKQSRQNCEHWINRDSPMYVEVNPEKFEKIIKVYRMEVIYSSGRRRGGQTKQVMKK